MKRFIIKIIIFLLVSFVFALALDVVITKGLHKYNDYVNEVWNDVRDTLNTPDLVILGSCAAHYDCNPRLIDSILGCNSYVCAMSNLTFPCHKFMWDMYRHYNKILPKTVVVVLDYGDLDYREVKTSQEDKQFLPLVDTEISRKFLLKYGGYSWIDIYMPLYRYYGHHDMIKHGVYSFFNLKKNVSNRSHYKGFISLDKPYSFHKEWYDSENYVKIQPEIIEMFDDFLVNCNENNINVVIVIAPLGYELESIICNVHDVYKVYEILSQKHNCKFKSFTSNDFSKDTLNFESPNHLNAQAADEFSIQLAKYIKSLNLY